MSLPCRRSPTRQSDAAHFQDTRSAYTSTYSCSTIPKAEYSLLLKNTSSLLRYQQPTVIPADSTDISPRQGTLDRVGCPVDVVPVQAQSRLQPQGIASTKAGHRDAVDVQQSLAQGHGRVPRDANLRSEHNRRGRGGVLILLLALVI